MIEISLRLQYMYDSLDSKYINIDQTYMTLMPLV